MAGFIRTINTAEVAFYIQNRSYASWKSLLENHEQQKYLNGWLAQSYPQFYPEVAKTDFSTPPEVLAGVNLRLNVAPDGEVTSSWRRMRTIKPDLISSATNGASSDTVSSFVDSAQCTGTHC